MNTTTEIETTPKPAKIVEFDPIDTDEPEGDASHIPAGLALGNVGPHVPAELDRPANRLLEAFRVFVDFCEIHLPKTMQSSEMLFAANEAIHAASL